MSFRRARIRQLRNALEAMGAIRDAVVVNILSYAHLPLPTRAELAKELPLEVERIESVPATEKPGEKRKVIHCFFDGEDHVIYPSDPGYESILNAAPGDRPKLFGRRPGSGKLKYPDTWY